MLLCFRDFRRQVTHQESFGLEPEAFHKSHGQLQVPSRLWLETFDSAGFWRGDDHYIPDLGDSEAALDSQEWPASLVNQELPFLKCYEDRVTLVNEVLVCDSPQG